ncbi:tRNA (guanine(46)-N(7))-methyltransferase TrmB [Noviherbaspirillum massiliense]|uniref:tRNA (guanine(46)-N(7))-methyltransferase TrmB n=1 Tax=Noviherbaspirillum massiliense TaxID=1465823 RepID=UPI0002D90955|nr:methyltransferase domain-containing protein [Noviherbaspirillum massiliense]
MHANSRPITTSQNDIHSQLASVVARHAATAFLKPILSYNRQAFEASMEAWQACGSKPLILDAGCGVGLSTRHLAQQFPDHFVIGVDQSAHRLSRNTMWQGSLPTNFMLVRADLVDYWRLMHAAGIRLARHYLLYPNPWPKIGQLARRWHGHAVFPAMLALGGEFECRSNWALYIEECAAAIRQLTSAEVSMERHAPVSPITPFEQKYLASGHSLWRCRARLSPVAAACKPV